jgi:hypothetical protein
MHFAVADATSADATPTDPPTTAPTEAALALQAAGKATTGAALLQVPHRLTAGSAPLLLHPQPAIGGLLYPLIFPVNQHPNLMDCQG